MTFTVRQPPPPAPPQTHPVEQEPMTGVAMEVAGVSGVSPVKKEGVSSEPVVVVAGGVRKWACPQCSTVRGSKNGCDTHIRQAHTGKVLLCGLCGFQLTILIASQGTSRNIINLVYLSNVKNKIKL